MYRFSQYRFKWFELNPPLVHITHWFLKRFVKSWNIVKYYVVKGVLTRTRVGHFILSPPILSSTG